MADQASSHGDVARAHVYAHAHGPADAQGAMYHEIHAHVPGQKPEPELDSATFPGLGPGLFVPVAAGPVVTTATDAAGDGGFTGKGAPASAMPRWFTPLRMLLIFSFVNLFVFLDRGLISSNGVNGSPRTDQNPGGSGIQGAFGLSYFEDGLLPAIFMVGLLLSCPVFAEAVKAVSAFRLLALGMGVWTVAVLGCSVAPTFSVLLLCRAAVGVGEASFVSLAAPFIDDYAPAAAKARWFAVFYLCTPVGYAFGYIMGGVVGSALSWRAAFALEALPMVPFVVFAATAPPLSLHAAQGDGAVCSPRSLSVAASALLADMRKVVCLPVWLAATGGYALYVAVLGIYAYWGPQAGRQLFFEDTGDAGAENADIAFGAISVVTGVLGTVAGGAALDEFGATLRSANVVCALCVAFGCVAALCAFALTTTFASFLGVFGVGQFFIFMQQAPVAMVAMWCVPGHLRPLSNALMTVCNHLFGDVPSPPLLGLLQSKLAEGKSPHDAAQQWRVSMSVATSLLLASAMLFAVAALKSVPGSDFRPAVISLGDAHAERSASMHEGNEREEEEGIEGEEEEGEEAEEEANWNNPSRTLLGHGSNRSGVGSQQTA